MKFLSQQTQNRWKFVTAIVKGGGLQIVTLYFKGD